MARLVVLSCRDRAIDAYMQPMFTRSIGEAVRAFTDAVNSKDNASQLAVHPEDFELFHIGYFEQDTAQFELVPHVSVAVGSAVKL